MLQERLLLLEESVMKSAVGVRLSHAVDKTASLEDEVSELHNQLKNEVFSYAVRKSVVWSLRFWLFQVVRRLLSRSVYATCMECREHQAVPDRVRLGKF